MSRKERQRPASSSGVTLGDRRVDDNVRRLLGLLPDCSVECIRDVILVSSGGDRGIVVLVTAEAFEIRLPTIEWTRGAYGPEPATRLWKRVRADRAADELLAGFMRRARERRLSEFRRCRYCGAMVPIEHRHGEVCHACAEAHLGVVH